MLSTSFSGSSASPRALRIVLALLLKLDSISFRIAALRLRGLLLKLKRALHVLVMKIALPLKLLF